MSAAGERAVTFQRKLHLSGANAGRLMQPRPWQESITREIWGRVDRKGRRITRTVFLLLPRGNGKTEFAAAQLAYGLACFPGARRLYSAAAAAEQAGLIYDAAASMIRQSPGLSARCSLRDSYRRIQYKPTGATYKALSADAETKHGYAAWLFIYDELHAARDSLLLDALVGSQGKVDEPLQIVISTAGNAGHVARDHVLWRLYQYACRVRDGEVDDPTWVVRIYERPKDLDWTDERAWHAANPALGDFLRIEHLRTEAALAKEIPANEARFRQWYLNDWEVGAESRWISADLWARNAGEIPDLSGCECFAALDLSATRDTTSLVLVFRRGEFFFVLPYFWLPGPAVEREREDHVPYPTWARLGFLTADGAPAVDYRAIVAKLAELATRYKIKAVAVDPWNALGVMQDLQRLGMTVVELRQGYKSLTYPTKELEKILLAERLRHGGHPVLAWQAGNVVLERDAADNVKPNKAKSTDRIDGIVALIMALGLAVVQKPSSVYETRGLLEF